MAQEDTEVPKSAQVDSVETDTSEERAKAYADFRTTVHKLFGDNPTCILSLSKTKSFEDIMPVDTQDGARVLLERIKPGQKSPKEWYLQDVMVIFPQSKSKQVDYNFDPTDGTVRKRGIDKGGRDKILELFRTESPDKFQSKAREVIQRTKEDLANLKLEEKTGQPVSASEAKRITNIIAQSTPVKI